jgi:hypothetical protein
MDFSRQRFRWAMVGRGCWRALVGCLVFGGRHRQLVDVSRQMFVWSFVGRDC